MDNNVNENRWGVLYCPKGGKRKVAAMWQKVQCALDERGVQYDFVQSENTESVERLMRMLINNGYRTIVIVGGDSALNDAVNCLMEAGEEVRSRIVLGVIPNGLMNDFARFWKIREGEVGRAVDWLVRRRARKIDLGCIRYTDAGGAKCRRYFLNCVNIGLTADMMDLRRRTHRLLGSRTLSFVVSSVLMLFHRLEYFVHLRMNGVEVRRKVMTVCIGNAYGYGQTPNAVPYNGLLDVSVVYHPEVAQLVAGVWLLLTGRFLNHRSVHPYRTREVEVAAAKHAKVGVDGRMMPTPTGPYTVGVVQEVVNFIIPD